VQDLLLDLDTRGRRCVDLGEKLAVGAAAEDPEVVERLS
jgi:hypothetical protein